MADPGAPSPPPPVLSLDHLSEVLHLSTGPSTVALTGAAAASAGGGGNVGRPTRPTVDGRCLVTSPSPSPAIATGARGGGSDLAGIAYRVNGSNLEAVRASLLPHSPREGDAQDDGEEEEEEEEEDEEEEFEPTSATVQILATTPLALLDPGDDVNNVTAANLAASWDGRMVAAACTDGSLRCFDVTLSSSASSSSSSSFGTASSAGANLALRWIRADAHSHATAVSGGSKARPTVNERYDSGGVAMGPIHSLSFAPGSYRLLLVDGKTGILSVYDCALQGQQSKDDGQGDSQGDGQGGQVTAQIGPDDQNNARIVCASWCPYNSNHLAAGRTNGEVVVYDLARNDGTGGGGIITNIANLGDMSGLGTEEDDEDEDDEVVGKGMEWCCTHLNWMPTSSSATVTGADDDAAVDAGTLAVGYCRIVSDPDAPPEDDVAEQDGGEDDEDDDADHQSKLVLVSLQSDDDATGTATGYHTEDMLDLEEVVPYFSVPKYGRHVYYTTLVQPATNIQLILVGSNVSSDFGVVGRVLEGQQGGGAGTGSDTWGEWTVMDLQEECAMTCPVNDDDDEFSYPTGFAAVRAELEGTAIAKTTILLSSTDGSLTPHVLERRDDHDGSFGRLTADGGIKLEAAPVEATTAPVAAAPGATAAATSAPAPAPDAAPATTPAKTEAPKSSIFGAGGGSTAAPTFGGFGGGSSAPAFGSGAAPAFGAGAAAPAFGSTAFGSGAAPAFGAGSPATGAGGGGFAALASSPAPASGGFGAFGGGGTAGGFSFGSAGAARTDPSMVKPLFGGTAAAAPRGADSDEDSESDRASASQASEADDETEEEEEEPLAKEPVPVTSPQQPQQEEDQEEFPDELLGTAETARAAFDSIDTSGSGAIPSDQFDALLDEIGEGFYGDEKDEQLAAIDPNNTGVITKKAFVSWYVQFVTEADADADGSASLDTADREEREDEMKNANDVFTALAGEGVDIIDSAEFGKLIESFGTTYCEEEHRRTIKKISNEDGTITRDVFVAWYLDWLFGGDESDIESEDEDNEQSAETSSAAPAPTSGAGWGSTFGVEEGSWKCDSCMVRNNADATKCAACETVRPGYEDQADSGTTGEGTAAGGASIGAGGFTFGGVTTSSGTSDTKTASIGAGGFSFGKTAPSPAATAAAPSSGFAFGGVPAAGGSVPITGGFQFGAKAPAPATATRESKDSAADKKKPSPASAAFPPLSTKAPTPFSGGAPASSKPPSAGALPPMSKTAPSPFGGGATSASPPPSKPSADAFPPMSKSAPSPFDGATSAASAKPSASTPFPPMSKSAPSPFRGGASTSAAAPAPAPAPAPPTKPPASTAFPPMSKTAPSPFGAAAAASPAPPPAPAKPSSLFPPMSKDAPSPFSSGVAATPALALAPAPLKPLAPKPFAGVAAGTAKAPAAAQAVSRPKEQRKPEAGTALAVVQKYEAATEYEAEMWKCVQEFDKSLAAIKDLAKDLSDARFEKNNSDLENKIERMIDECDQVKSTSMSFDEKVRTQSDRALFLLSQKDDLERQVKEAERLLNEQLRDYEGINMVRDQPLDGETDKMRRQIAASALETQHSIAHVKQRLLLLIDILEASETKPVRTAYSFGSPRHVPDRKKKAQMALKGGVLRGYERAQQLSNTTGTLQKRVKEAADAVPASKPSSVTNASARKSRTRIAPLPVTFTSPSASAKKQSKSKDSKGAKDIVQRQAAVENAIRMFAQRQQSLPTKKFSHRGVIGSDASQIRRAAASDWRSKGAKSQLMNSASTPVTMAGVLATMSTPPASTPSRSLFTPPPSSAGKGRSEWDVKNDVDQSKFNSMQVKMPTSVRTIDSADAARKALQPFGTTPEKIAKVQEVKSREGRQPAATEQKPPLTIKKKPSTSSGFPPLPSTAPTPFSAEKTAPSGSSFPPMSSTAPKPFGVGGGDGGGAGKKDVAQAAAKAPPSAFPPMSLKAPSKTPLDGGGGVTTKDDDKKKDEETAPPPSGLTPKASLEKDSSSTNNLFGLARPGTKKEDKPFGGGGFGGGLSSFGGDLSGALGGAATASAPSQPDYNAVLTKFYSAHNPAKVAEVEKTLLKYKGKEEAMFAKLAQKYGVANPLTEASSSVSSTPPPSTAPSPFGATPAAAPSSANTAPSPFGTSPAGAPSSAGDYRSILTCFYQTHNPSHLGDVDKLLAKYNGREPEMFLRLAKKYNVPNPLPADMQGPAKPPSTLGSSSGGSLFGSGGSASASPSLSSLSSAPANVPPPSPFGASAAKAPAPSPFGPPSGNAPAPSPFGGGGGIGGLGGTTTTPFQSAASPSPFGQPPAAAPTTPFGAPAPAASTPFGQSAAPAPSPFGVPSAPPAAAPGEAKLFNGKSARDMLTSFYQQKDPSKLANVDKVLAKYAGQEETMFRNLAKKYGVEASMFGVSAAAPAAGAFGAQSAGISSGGFGQQSTLGGGGGFGSPAAPSSGLGSASGFGSPSAMGGAPAFGSAAGGGGGGFGSLAQAPAAGGFASAAPASFGGAAASSGGFGSAPGGFGSPGLGGGPSPFGSARR